MNQFVLEIIRVLYSVSWFTSEFIFLIVYAYIIFRFKISGQKTAIFGFITLGMTALFSIFHLDFLAGKAAEFVWMLFAVAFIQEFYHFLKYENK